MKQYIFMIFMVAMLAVSTALSGCGESGQTENQEPGSPDSDPAEAADESFMIADGKQEVQPEEQENETAGDHAGEEENMVRKMIVEIGGSRFTAVLENNEAADALTEMMKENPVTIQMRDYAGFEKVGALGSDLPASDRQITARPGDIVLYQGNQIVMFYGSNSWSYTRLGRIEDLTGWEAALGDGDATVIFSLME